MKWLFDLARRILFDLHGNLWALLVYDAVLAVLSFLLLTPLLSWAASLMMSSSGRLSVTNAEILSFLLSAHGILFVLVVGSLMVVTWYVKHAGMMLIAWEGMAGRRMGPLRAFRGVLQRLPGLTLLGVYHVAGHAILLAPFAIAATLVYRLAFSSMRVYFLFLESAAARWIGVAAAAVFAATAVVIHGVVYLHWAFSLPALLLDHLSVRSALTYTHRLLAVTRRRIGAVALSGWIATVLLPFALAQGFYWFGGAILARLPEEHRLNLPVVLSLMAAYLATSFLGEFLTLAVNSLTITRLYGDLRGLAAPQDASRPASHARRPAHPSRIIVFLILAAVVSLSGAAAIVSRFDLRDRVKITAHRGSSFAAPENTLIAIRKAVEDGADYAEVDVRLTADGHAVLVHDRDLFRVAGIPQYVADLTYEQIKTLDVGTWFSPQFRGERIPLLSEVVAYAKGRIRLNIELKVDGFPRRTAARIVRILREQDAVSECVVSSANIEVLGEIRRLDSAIRTGYVISQSIGRVTTLDVDFLSVSSRLATPALIDAARAAGKEVHVWTVNKPGQMARLIDLGVDNIITDVPGLAKALLDERAAMGNEELLFLKVRHWFLR